MSKLHEHNIDDIFSEAFDDFKIEPSEDLWGKIKKEIPSKEKKTPFYFKWTSPSILIILAFSISSLAYLGYKLSSSDNLKNSISENTSSNNSNINSKENYKSNKPNNTIKNINQVKPSNKKNLNETKTISKAEENTIAKIEKQVITNTSTPAEEIEILPIAKKPSKNIARVEPEKKKTVNTKPVNETKINENINISPTKYISDKATVKTEEKLEQTTSNNSKNIATTAEIKTEETTKQTIGDSNQLITKQIVVTDSTNTSTDSTTTEEKDFYSSSSIASSIPKGTKMLQFYYAPSYTKLNSIHYLEHSIGIGYTYQIKRIEISGGLEIYLNKDKYNQEAKYFSYDSTILYQDVDSLIFNGNTPTYITHNEMKFDSITHIQNLIYNRNLMYIKIPLSIGYQANWKKLVLSAHTGLAYNKLINQTPSDNNLQNNVTLDETNKNNFALNKSYLQAFGSFRIGYRLSDEMIIAIEPQFMKSVNKIYSNQEFKSTSFRIKASLQINL